MPNPKEKSTVEFVEGLKRRWMATVDALIDPLMIIDKDYSIKKANMALAKSAGCEIKSVIGKKCYQVFAKRDMPCQECNIGQALEKTKHYQFHIEDFRASKYMEVTSQSIFDPEDGKEGILLVYRDRTEARRMQQIVVQSEKLASIGLLAGGIAHEINNPLGGILIFSQMLLREMSPKSPHYQDVVEIESATQRCKAIVENLLEFARQQPISAKKADLETVNVGEAIKSALRFSQVGKKDNSVDIQLEGLKENITILGNNNKLQQLFLNLIQNAFHAMPGGGTLTLICHSEIINSDITAVIEIKDTGVGIPREKIKKIFDPFYTSKSPGEGTGLGLAICHGIVTDHGGTIEVDSLLNSGSCFRIEIPMKK